MLLDITPGRFTFHDLIHAYALSLLGERPAAASARLVSHYVHVTSEAVATFSRPGVALKGAGRASPRVGRHSLRTRRRDQPKARSVC